MSLTPEQVSIRDAETAAIEADRAAAADREAAGVDEMRRSRERERAGLEEMERARKNAEDVEFKRELAQQNLKKADENRYGFRAAASAIAAKYMRSVLISPSTAKFPWSDVSVQQTDDKAWVVESYVDAENQFGARLRYKYKVRVMKDADSDNWSILSVRVTLPNGEVAKEYTRP